DRRGPRGDRLQPARREPVVAIAHRIYARALFEAAQDEGNLEKVQAQLTQLRDAVDSVDELRLLLENPEVDSRVKQDVLARSRESSEPAVVNFLKLLAEKGRAAEIDEVTDEFDALVAAEQRILDVQLTTAHELSDQEFGRILGRIEEASGR